MKKNRNSEKLFNEAFVELKTVAYGKQYSLFFLSICSNKFNLLFNAPALQLAIETANIELAPILDLFFVPR